MEIDYTGFEVRLNYLLKEKNITLKELADKIDVNCSSVIVRWKKGTNGIKSIQTVSKIAKELGVKPEWLLYGYVRKI